MTTPSSNQPPVPGSFDHIARECVTCGAVGPFRRPAKSQDPFRCCACGQPERYVEPAAPVTNLAVQDLKTLEAVSAVHPAPSNVSAEHAKPPQNGDAARTLDAVTAELAEVTAAHAEALRTIKQLQRRVQELEAGHG